MVPLCQRYFKGRGQGKAILIEKEWLLRSYCTDLDSLTAEGSRLPASEISSDEGVGQSYANPKLLCNLTVTVPSPSESLHTLNIPNLLGVLD